MAENCRTATEARIEQTRLNILDRHFRYEMEGWCARGWIRSWIVQEDIARESIRLVLDMPHGGRPLSYWFTRTEIEMGGLNGLRFWLDTIERDLRNHFDEAREYHRSMRAPSGLSINQQRINETYRRMMDAAELMIQPNIIGWDEMYRSPFTDDAEEKSKELFVAAAGNEAFQTLESGKPLPINGSEGTAYHLFKRASYCVERPHDGARLCAVVPNVPLWDHLLGIKLMVEHDEPTFLKTANVSGGRRANFSRALNPYAWV